MTPWTPSHAEMAPGSFVRVGDVTATRGQWFCYSSGSFLFSRASASKFKKPQAFVLIVLPLLSTTPCKNTRVVR